MSFLAEFFGELFDGRRAGLAGERLETACAKTHDTMEAKECPFYSHPRAVAMFKEYVRHVLEHVNPSTGLPLSQDPAGESSEAAEAIRSRAPRTRGTPAGRILDGAARRAGGVTTSE